MSRDHLGQFMMASNLAFARGVLLLEDSEGTFTWTPSGTGGDDVHAFATAAAFMGLNGIQLKTRTTSAAADDLLSVQKWCQFPESGLLVLRARIASPALAAVKAIYLTASVHDGALNAQGQMMWSPNTPRVAYQNLAGAAVPITEMAFTTENLAFITLELVLDLDAMNYIAIAWNGIRKLLPAIPMYAVGSSALREVILGVSVTSIAAAPAQAYVDTVYAGEFLDL